MQHLNLAANSPAVSVVFDASPTGGRASLSTPMRIDHVGVDVEIFRRPVIICSAGSLVTRVFVLGATMIY